MGTIKFNGKVVYVGDIARTEIIPNWCNSMADYYPTVRVYSVINGDEVVCKHIDIVGFSNPTEHNLPTFEIDKSQESDLKSINRRREQEKEAKTVSFGKPVRVVRGRKVPIGTEGEVFWMGDRGWGMSVGIRLIDGKRVFTSLNNVEVINADKVFETFILGLKAHE